MTPHEYNSAMKVWIEDSENNHKLELLSAWLNAAWQRMQKMPSINLVLYGVDRPQYTKKQMDEAREFHAKLMAGKENIHDAV